MCNNWDMHACLIRVKTGMKFPFFRTILIDAYNGPIIIQKIITLALTPNASESLRKSRLHLRVKHDAWSCVYLFLN